MSADGVSLTVSLSRDDIALNDAPILTAVVRAPGGMPIRFEEYADADTLQEHRFEFRLRVVDAKEREDSGQKEWIRKFEVVPFLPGKYELPAMVVRYKHAAVSGSTDGDDWRELRSEPIGLTVREPSQPLSAEQLKQLQTLPPVELPAPWGWKWAILVAAVAFGALAAAMFFKRHSRRAVRAVVLSPQEWARRQFAALIAEELLAKGLWQEFHYRVSEIVRGYIERRFLIAAAEMTTEEFLARALSDARLQEHLSKLRRFLEECDLVKYARRVPLPEESQGVLRGAMDFVEQTSGEVGPHETGKEVGAR